jgi:hypothetical protein
MGLPVTITVNVNGDDYITFDYSVKQYFMSQYDNSSSSQALKNMCKAGLDYGAQAQLYFDGKSYKGGIYATDPANLVNETINPSNTIPDIEPPTGYSPTANISEGFAGISKVTASLILGSEISIKVYFKYSGNINGLTFTASRYGDSSKTKIVTDPVAESNGRYSVKVTGIKSYELYRYFTLTMKDAGGTFTLDYSPYYYAQQHWNNEDTLLANLVRTLVAYGECAKTLWPNA